VEVETLTDDGKTILIGLINNALIIEYDFILNYPRMIDKLVNYDKINDEMLINNLERLGSESMKHFNHGITLIEKLGGEPKWQIGTIERLEEVEDLLMKQSGKEKEAISIYRAAILAVHKNKQKAKVKGFFNMLIHANDNLPIKITVSELIEHLNIELAEENNHVKLVEDSIAMLQIYSNE
jgi:bacterioferritin (cytochrome b1)